MNADQPQLHGTQFTVTDGELGPSPIEDRERLMVGWAGAAWHLELVGDPEDATPAAPTEEDLLVLYLGGEVDEDLVRRLIAAGGTRVSARNPYWDRWGITIADPDGYRLVLSTLSWP